MGQKVNPIVLRIGYIENWRSLWYADPREYAKNVIEDSKIRQFIKKRFVQAAISKIVIERLAEKIKIIIHTARPGVIIGRRGADIDKLRSELGQITSREIAIEPQEIKNPVADAQLIAQNIAFQLEKRVAFRRAMKRAIDQAMGAGVKGIKIKCSGRLNGAEMARSESYRVGKLPLHTFRAQIDYGFAEALTTYGILGVKVWANKGEIIKEIKRKGKTGSAEGAVQNVSAKPAPAAAG
ncbi:MAG: 30S ribosomal protein S3 [Omnitrophica WOR_2 bacterium RIFCSPLOWO2_12_FULL_50_9]|nr:MAG: 30S ribosomal protein S3 [Omnitrophica WOR_2 bacterium RIFCSPHIGHO2_02_FULL_50_17]OGX42318.1 MAG: 30S ribosomal protein S3 [Omnitrophica WOR_2 bacterium RIFCSPLOWO2_12_FULL_50_9]